MDPATLSALAAGGSQIGSLISSLLMPGSIEFTASDLRELLESTRRAGFQQIHAGVGRANEAAAAQAAQAGITSPNFLTRMIGLNEMTGGQQASQFEAGLSQQEIGGRMQIALANLGAKQAKYGQLSQGLSETADPLAQLSLLQYMSSNPTLTSLYRGEVQ